MGTVTLASPAKLNLFLAINGRRPDGFHDLLSVAAPLKFADTLTVTAEPGGVAGKVEATLTCTDPEVPVDETNLVLRAARAFGAATGWTGKVAFHLEKRIPMGAGLGGGSSNGAAALRGLNTLAGAPLDDARLREVAATLGSDCPLFLHDGPVVMRGRGERIEPLAAEAAARLRGRSVLVFKPAFGVPTAWAYQRLAKMAGQDPASGAYLPTEDAERRLAQWIGSPQAEPNELLFNNMELAAFDKFVALPTLIDLLHRRFGLAPRMTGSGSACFAFVDAGAPMAEITRTIAEAWGDSSLVLMTQLA